MEIVAQIIGIVGMTLNILSFQCKKNRNLFIMMGIGGVMWVLNYFLLGAIVGAAFNAINIARSFLAIKDKTRTKLVFVIVVCLYIVTVIFTYESFVSILLLIAQIVGTYAMWFGDGKRIRTLQLCVVSPIWLLNNILVFTIGGIIAEVFTIASAIISFFRYRKTGFEK